MPDGLSGMFLLTALQSAGRVLGRPELVLSEFEADPCPSAQSPKGHQGFVNPKISAFPR
jgi:hypothetical protein